MNYKLPELHQFKCKLHDAYTLKCIKLLASYHSRDNTKVLELLHSTNVVIRESALYRIETHPEGIDKMKFIELSLSLLNSSDEAYLANVLKAVLSILETVESNELETIFISNEFKQQYQNKLQELLKQEPLIESLCIDILMRFGMLQFEHVEKISSNENQFVYFFKNYYQMKNTEMKQIVYKKELLKSILQENIEHNIMIMNAFNVVFNTNYDIKHIISFIMKDIVTSLQFISEEKQKEIEKETIEKSGEEILLSIIDYELFEYLKEITQTNQLFEPELPNYLYDRIALLKEIECYGKNLIFEEIMKKYLLKLKEYANQFVSEHSIELMKQMKESLNQF